MAKRTVDVSVALQRSLRVTLKSMDLLARPRPSTLTAFEKNKKCATEKTKSVSFLQRMDLTQSNSPIFVDAKAHPEDILAMMVGQTVRDGKTTFAVPAHMLVPSEDSKGNNDSSSLPETFTNSHHKLSQQKSQGNGNDKSASDDSVLHNLLLPSQNSSHDLTTKHILKSNSHSIKDVAAAWLRPKNIDRLEFNNHRQQSLVSKFNDGISENKIESLNDSGLSLNEQQQLIEQTVAARVHDVQNFLKIRQISPATLRIGEQEASLLHFAALHDSVDAVEKDHTVHNIFDLLINDFKIPVDVCALNGATPLHWAAGNGNMEAVAVLMDAGADRLARTWTWDRSVFGRGSGQTPLHWAAESGHLDVVSLLSSLAQSADDVCLNKLIMAAPDERGQTPADVAGSNLQWDAHQALRLQEDEQYIFFDLEVLREDENDK